ncbi:MAG: RNase A-like domain-containing protein [Chloroflexota bacterium]
MVDLRPIRVFVDNSKARDQGGWVQAGDLRVGDRVRTANGHDLVVTSLRYQVDSAHVYTLTVATDHDFFVGSAGVLVHNAGGGPCPPGAGLIPGSSLQENEAFENAHVLAEHMGKSDTYLLKRLQENAYLRFASTFPNQRTALSAIAQALKSSQSQIRQYLDSMATANRAYTVDVGFTTGRVWARGASASEETQAVTVIIRKPSAGSPQPGPGYFIVSAYPSK